MSEVAFLMTSTLSLTRISSSSWSTQAGFLFPEGFDGASSTAVTSSLSLAELSLSWRFFFLFGLALSFRDVFAGFEAEPNTSCSSCSSAESLPESLSSSCSSISMDRVIGGL
uniref:Putative secreted protein n=1 Tax=Ixodes ricinus TaxID=34613 RepID=A0A6B0UJU8_IXORI